MADTSSQISIYIPAVLAESVPHASSRHTCLETLIARSDTTRTALRGDERLLTLFGGDAAGASGRAAVSHHAQHEDGDVTAWRIIASPVHLLADHATLHFPSQHSVSLNDEESRALMASCQDHFAEEGWQLEYGDAQGWYLSLREASAITTTAPADAVGKSLFEALPQGKDARLWRRWSNEVQMLLHSHAVNEARQARGQPPINSLWFWGEGRLPALTKKPFTRVFGGDGYVQGLARLSGVAWAPLPGGISALDGSALAGALVVLDAAAAATWDSHWFCALAKKLREKSLNSAALHFGDGYTSQLHRSLLWRFWRRKRLSLAMNESAS